MLYPFMPCLAELCTCRRILRASTRSHSHCLRVIWQCAGRLSGARLWMEQSRYYTRVICRFASLLLLRLMPGSRQLSLTIRLHQSDFASVCAPVGNSNTVVSTSVSGNVRFWDGSMASTLCPLDEVRVASQLSPHNCRLTTVIVA